MTKPVKRIALLFIAFLLLLGVMLPSLVVSVNAETVNYGETKYNLELVIDRSTSLDTTDRDKNRYSALQFMFATLPTSGNDMGATVFNNRVASVAPASPIRSQGEKDALYEKIVAQQTQTGGTDIGLALLEGVNKLVQKKQEQINQTGTSAQSVLILFTDGITEVSDKTTSFANRDKAIKLAKENEIWVLGVFLNAGGEIEGNQEVFDIVRTVRNRADDPVKPQNDDGTFNDLDRSYSEITDVNDIASDIVGSFSNLVHKLLDGGEAEEPQQIPLRKEMLIPGIGVSELNIAVRYKSGVLPKIIINIERPDGTKISHDTTIDVIITKTAVFFNAKISNPMSGKWIVTVDPANDAAKSEKIEVIPDIIIDTNVTAKLSYEADGGVILHQSVPFTSWLEQAGKSVDTDGSYALFECTLTLINVGMNEKREFKQVSANGNGRFKWQIPFDDYDGYTAFVTYACDRIYFRSDDITIRAKNRPPVVEPNPIKENYNINWLFGKTYSLDLSKYVTDPEGGILTYSINGDYPKTVLDSSKLTIDAKETGVKKIKLIVKDDQGESVDFEFELTVKNNSLLVTLFSGVLILLVIAAVLLLIRTIFGGYIDARLHISIENSKSSAINEKYEYGEPTQVSLINFNKPYVTLNEACASMLDRVNDDVKDALSDLFNTNKKILNDCSFKRVPGFDRALFVFSNRTEVNKREPFDMFVATVILSDDERIKIVCNPRRKLRDPKEPNDFDD